MRTFWCIVASLLFSFLPGCSDAGVSPGVEFNDQFNLAYAHTVRLPDGSEIYFKDVLEDSRCPVDVMCVWAGKNVVLNTALDPKSAIVGAQPFAFSRSTLSVPTGRRFLFTSMSYR